jgi:hypothetical protein
MTRCAREVRDALHRTAPLSFGGNSRPCIKSQSAGADQLDRGSGALLELAHTPFSTLAAGNV